MGVSSSAPTAAKGQPPLPPPSFAAPSPPPVLSEAEALVVLKESHREAVQSPSRAHSGAFEAAQRVACESLLRTLPTLAQADGGDADATHAVRSHILAEISAWLSAGYVSAELALVVRDDVVECACRAMDAGSVGKRQFLTGVKAWQAEGLLSDGAFDGVKSRTIAALVARKSGAAALLSGGCWKWNWHAAADAATFALVDRRRESGHAEAALDLLVDEWAKRRATDSARDRETECAFKWRIARAYVEMTEWRSAGRALESQIRRGLKHANEARELCAQAAGIEAWAASLPAKDAYAWAQSEMWWGLAAGLLLQHKFVKTGWDRKEQLALGAEIQAAFENSSKLWMMVDDRGDPLLHYALARLHYEYAQLGPLASGLSALGVVVPRSTYDAALSYCKQARDSCASWGLARHSASNAILASRCYRKLDSAARGAREEALWLELVCPNADEPSDDDDGAPVGHHRRGTSRGKAENGPHGATPKEERTAAGEGGAAEWARPAMLPMSPEEIRDRGECQKRLHELLRSERGAGSAVMCCGGLADLFHF